MTMPIAVATNLAEILERGKVWRGADAGFAPPGTPSGFAELDAELPGGGWPSGCLTEILPQHEGIGEVRLLGPALARLAAVGRWLAWIAPPHLPYAPALTAAGIDLARLFIVRTGKRADTLWAMEQALRSNACGAVLAWPGHIRYTELRRLQIAAEGSQAFAALFRPPAAAHESSPAALRLKLETLAGGIAVRILKRRGAVLTRPVQVRLAPVVHVVRAAHATPLNGEERRHAINPNAGTSGNAALPHGHEAHVVDVAHATS
jgi:hypothetical protein